MTVTRYYTAAQVTATLVNEALKGAGIDTEPARYVLTEADEGDAWLLVQFNALDRQSVEKILTPAVLDHLKILLGGHPLTLCRQKDLCLAVLLSPAQTFRLPAQTSSPITTAPLNRPT